jgi:hypothetical protein
METVDQLTKPADQTLALSELFRYYPTIRTFLPKLMAAISLEATPAGHSILEAWEFLKTHNGVPKNKKKRKQAPLSRMNTSWRKIVVDNRNGQIDPRTYTFWVLE